jgi:hypothetical protein
MLARPAAGNTEQGLIARPDRFKCRQVPASRPIRVLGLPFTCGQVNGTRIAVLYQNQPVPSRITGDLPTVPWQGIETRHQP